MPRRPPHLQGGAPPSPPAGSRSQPCLPGPGVVCYCGSQGLSSVHSLCPLDASVTLLCDNQDWFRALPGALRGHGPRHRSLCSDQAVFPPSTACCPSQTCQTTWITSIYKIDIYHGKSPAGKKKLTSVKKKTNYSIRRLFGAFEDTVHHTVICKVLFNLFLSPLQSILAIVPEIDDCQCGVALSRCVGGVTFLSLLLQLWCQSTFLFLSQVERLV